MILVTGGAGFIGSNIVSRLSALGRRVVVADWLGTGEKWRNLASARLHDLIAPPALWTFLEREGDGLEAIIHMGAISATTERCGDRLVEHNVRLTIDLWTWCARHGVAFIYASSAATYGDGAAGFEDDWSEAGLDRLKPLNGYGWSKHVADRRIAADVAAGRPQPPKWAGLKFFNVFGPHEAHKGPMRSVIHQIYPAVCAGEPVRLFKSHRPDYADGGQVRDFIYVKDAVEVIIWMLAATFPSGIYNLGSGQARSWLDLAHAVFASAGRPARIEFIDTPEDIRGAYQYFTQASMGRLRAAGCDVTFLSLEDAVEDYIKVHLSQTDPYL
jgi:ADP-L-glycero-D-manno-heptose 6-epimerase